MGLFDKFKSEKKVSEYKPGTEQEAWMAIIYGCLAADGDVSSEEINILADILKYNSFYDGFKPVELYKKVGLEHHSIGSKELISKSAPLVSHENRHTLFTIIIRLILADGKIEDQEKEIADYIKEVLKIEDELAEKIIEVVLIMNKFEVVIADDDEDDY